MHLQMEKCKQQLNLRKLLSVGEPFPKLAKFAQILIENFIAWVDALRVYVIN